jgi:hypothetical protein
MLVDITLKMSRYDVSFSVYDLYGLRESYLKVFENEILEP